MCIMHYPHRTCTPHHPRTIPIQNDRRRRRRETAQINNTLRRHDVDRLSRLVGSGAGRGGIAHRTSNAVRLFTRLTCLTAFRYSTHTHKHTTVTHIKVSSFAQETRTQYILLYVHDDRSKTACWRARFATKCNSITQTRTPSANEHEKYLYQFTTRAPIL